MDFDFENQTSSKTNEELLDIYINQSRYQGAYVEVIKRTLIERNVPFDAVEKLKEEKDAIDISQFVAGRQGSPLYIAICFIIALCGGIPSIISGYIYSNSKHEGPDGSKYYVYNSSTRKLGMYMMLLGFCMLFLYFIILK